MSDTHYEEDLSGGDIEIWLVDKAINVIRKQPTTINDVVCLSQGSVT